MNPKAKLLAAIVAVVLLVAAWLLFAGGPAPGPVTAAAPPATSGPPSTHGNVPAPAPDATSAAEPRAEVTPTPAPAPATTGSLRVLVRYADEPQPGAFLAVLLRRGVDLRAPMPRAVTDEQGVAFFEGLPPGNVRALVEYRLAHSVPTTIEPGTTAECTLTLGGGITLTGIVVDQQDRPVPGALVEASMPAISQIDARPIAVAGPDGTFTLRQSDTLLVIGARAQGHAASQLHLVQASPGAREHVRLQLGPPAGEVVGEVLDAHGPVAGATVRIGEGRTEGIMASDKGAPPLPAQVHTDADGRFRAIGVPPGPQPILCRTPEHAPFTGTCEVGVGGTTAVRILLQEGVTCRGSVRNEAGAPVPVTVTVGDIGDFDLVRTRSGADGAFVLTGLPDRPFTVRAADNLHGKASVTVQGRAGAAVQCELILSQGLAVCGRVVDEAGAGVGMVQVLCATEGSAQRRPRVHWTDREGRFVFPDCEPGRRFTVHATHQDGRESRRHGGVAPGPDVLELRLQRNDALPARIVGRLLRPDGSGAEGAAVAFQRSDPQQYREAKVAPDGSFAAEVVAGSWWVRIDVRGHPQITLPRRELQPGEVWALGDLRLTVGGVLVVDDGGEKLHYLVFDAAERFVCGVYAPLPPPRSELLAPGEYVLLARADGRAAQALPFLIEAGKDSRLEVRLAEGVRQRLVFDAPVGAETPGGVGFVVRRGGRMVLHDAASGRDGSAPFRAIWLPPGDYELVTRDREPVTRVAFTVGAAEGRELRVQLR